jgi:hypothetical protein
MPPPAPPHVNQPVGGLDHIEVVLDHHHGVAMVAQGGDDLQQQRDVLKVQTGRRFIEDVERAPGVAL